MLCTSETIHVLTSMELVREEGSMESDEGVVVRGRVEIDMRKPFRSVKEAVALFGEKILVGEIYVNKVKDQMQVNKLNDGQHISRIGVVTAELIETRQTLQKTREEGNLMAYCLESLKQELQQTKRELEQLKSRSDYDDPEIVEELKFVEDHSFDQVLDKKRSVKFASPPSLTKVMVSKDIVDTQEWRLLRKDDKHISSKNIAEDIKISPSPGKKLKRKPLIPMIGGLFSKKK